MGTITEQELPTKYIRINENVIREKHLLVIKNADYVTQLLKTLHVWYVIVLKCQQGIIHPYAMTEWEKYYTFLIYKNTSLKSKSNTFKNLNIYVELNTRRSWWNITIKTAAKIPHNKPDLIIWNHQKVVCTVVDFSCPLDSNITKKVAEKKNNYEPLIRNMQIMYPNYKLEMIPVVIGCLGFVQSDLEMYMKQLRFDNKEILFLVRRLQIASMSGTVNTCKTFFNFNDAK